MTTDSILDIVVILLLVPTIVYAVILNRRLTALRKSRDELSKVVNSFNEATMRAEAGIPKLKKATTEANLSLKDRVEKAQTLRDDLAFMIERAEELAGRLEGAVRVARSEGVSNVAQVQAVTAPGARATYADAAPRSAAPAAGTLAHTVAGFEETAADLRSALGAARAEAGVPGRAAQAAPAPAAAAGFPRPKRTLESQFERAARPEQQSLEEERSEAERELLKALQSAR
ncbi:MAG: DUF6468 domain-containing protein [Rhodospirillaceae bacterium]